MTNNKLQVGRPVGADFHLRCHAPLAHLLNRHGSDYSLIAADEWSLYSSDLNLMNPIHHSRPIVHHSRCKDLRSGNIKFYLERILKS